MTNLTDRPHQVDTAQLGGMERRNRVLTITVVTLAIGLLALGAWAIYDLTAEPNDPSSSAEYIALEQELAQTEVLLAELTAGRERVTAAEEAAASRYEKASATSEEIIALLDNPKAFGTEEEVADLIAAHSTSGAVMDDDVFGAVPYRAGFYNTLYAGAMDAEIDVYDSWVSDDGSQGGALWMWHGTNAAGNPFELAGISLNTYDDEGLISYELVTYPYPDEYVQEAVLGEGT